MSFADLPAPPSCYFCSDGLEEKLTSYGYPTDYRNNMECIYEIKKPQGSNFCAVQMVFTEFDLQESFECNEDFLAIDDEKYCGNILASKTSKYSLNSIWTSLRGKYIPTLWSDIQQIDFLFSFANEQLIFHFKAFDLSVQDMGVRWGMQTRVIVHLD